MALLRKLNLFNAFRFGTCFALPLGMNATNKTEAEMDKQFVNPSHLTAIEYFALTHFAEETWTYRQNLRIFSSIAVPAIATAWLLFIALLSA